MKIQRLLCNAVLLLNFNYVFYRKMLFILLLPFFSKAQIITTVAGNGVNGYGGDGLPATAASFKAFSGIALDTLGNLYIADANNHRVRKVDVYTNIIHTIAGTGVMGFSGDGGIATIAKLNDPKFVVCDKIGNLFISDVGNNRIRKVNLATGTITTYAGNGASGFSGDGISATATSLYGPQGLAVDIYGNLFFSDANNFRIRKINKATGIINTIAGTGTYGYSGDGGQADTAKISGIEGICIDKKNNLYLADGGNLRVRKVDAITNTITTIAGNGFGGFSGDGGPATDAKMTIQFGITADTFGNIYISDMYNSRIRMVDTFGVINTLIGNGINGFHGDGGFADTCELWYPQITAFDRCNNFYIADLNNLRVRKVTFNPTCTLPSLNINTTVANPNISLYPNPANEQITITANQIIANVTITNLIGQTLLNENFKSETAEVNISKLPPGVYLVAITYEEGKKTVRKIVKQ